MAKNHPVSKKSQSLSGRDLYRARTTAALLELGTKLQLYKQLPVEKTPGELRLRQRIKFLKEQLKKAKVDSPSLNNTIGSYDIAASNELASPPLGKLKFTKRQKEFTWLNTHVWHAKRAHMMKRWGWQIPLKPTQKCFRSTHRGFNLDGAIAWDKSYIGTVVLQSDNESSLVEMLNQIVLLERPLTKLKSNGHSMVKMVRIDDQIVGEATVLTFHDQNMKRVVVRSHPSIYTQLFKHLVTIRTEDVDVIDDRFAIGSIEIAGPISLSSLATILKPIYPKSRPSQIFGDLCSETNLPERTMFTFYAQDPRLANRAKPRPRKNVNTYDVLIDMKSTQSSLDQSAINALFTSEGRTESYKDQHSLKQIAQEKNKPFNERSKGIGFPVILFNSDSRWTLLLPWYWTLPVWHALMHIAHIKLGGLKQSHQMKFEKGELFFPIDYPFTEIGHMENKLTADVRRESWAKKPLSKRLNYEKVKICSCDLEQMDIIQIGLHSKTCAHSRGELGDPFGSDWRYLQVLKIALPYVKSNDLTRTSRWDNFNRKIEELHDVYNLIEDVKASKIPNISKIPVELKKATEYPHSIEQPLPVTTVKFTTCSRGRIDDNARVYAIPAESLSKWTATLAARHITGSKNHDIYPSCPSSEYLIGFVTSGTFNLYEGKSTGVGCVDSVWASKRENYVLVRQVGTNVVRLAKWEAVDTHCQL
jgi:ribonuclease P/MRP protein subunit POP1